MPHTEKKQCAGDENWTQDKQSSLDWWQAGQYSEEEQSKVEKIDLRGDACLV